MTHDGPGTFRLRLVDPPPPLEPPPFLRPSPDQLAWWRRCVASAPPGVLRPIDSSIVWGWAVAAELRARVLDGLAAMPADDPAAPSGPGTRRHVLASIAADQEGIMAAMEAELGFRPPRDAPAENAPEAGRPGA